VFMCTKCRGFTNAPLGQKRRRCSYCGSIIDITKANVALFDTPEQAQVAVKEFNASKGGDDFTAAVEKSRDRVKALLPPQQINAKDITDGNERTPPQGKRRTLMTLLQKEARKKPCSLDMLEEMCEARGLEWKWVEKQIESLANNGALIFPRPWTVQLVNIEGEKENTTSASKDVSSEIVSLLKSKGGKLRVEEVVEHFTTRGVSESSVESSLERLMRSGDIFQPSPGYVKII